nr:MAG TPA: hypothetical protein [Caudoviricetes sp.]
MSWAVSTWTKTPPKPEKTPPATVHGGGRSLFQQTRRRESVERRAHVRGIIELPSTYE